MRYRVKLTVVAGQRGIGTQENTYCIEMFLRKEFDVDCPPSVFGTPGDAIIAGAAVVGRPYVYASPYAVNPELLECGLVVHAQVEEMPST